ncbi:hypothetical protein KY362_03430 [Candidatus Woesearchaeota archaeon]|nr:hypothetical protein [Candidatus Woesearchaeota archaeon]
MGPDSLMLAFVFISIISIFLFMYMHAHKLKGTFTHPPADKKMHVDDILGLVNHYLEVLRDTPGIASVLEKEGYRQAAPQKLRITPANIVIQYRSLSPVVWRFDIGEPKEVSGGNIGRVLLNRYHFSLRTSHHRFAMHLAAELFYLHLMAAAGKDPRTIQKKLTYVEKCGKALLAKAGLLGVAGDLDDKHSIKLMNMNQRLDEEIAYVLKMSEKEGKDIEGEIDAHAEKVGFANTVKTASNGFRGKDHHKKKLIVMLNHEVRHIHKLQLLMGKKRKAIDEFVHSQHIHGHDKAAWVNYLHLWEQEMLRMGSIRQSLEVIADNSDRWTIVHTYWHHWQRLNASETADAANKLQEEASKAYDRSGKKKIDINRVEAILTSLTAARSRIIKELYWSEELA